MLKKDVKFILRRTKIWGGLLFRPRVLFLFLSFSLKKFANDKSDEKKEKLITYLIGFNDWKTFLHEWFPERELVFLPMKLELPDFIRLVGPKALSEKKIEIFQWGFKVDKDVDAFIKHLGIKRYKMEDGFIRSIGLGSSHTKPFSQIIDSRTLYFDSREESDLEVMLQNYSFADDAELMANAKRVMSLLVSTGISKYNLPSEINIEKIYGEKTKKRVLVVGQVEDDASIMYGCDKNITNNDLVTLAALENPEAQIIYKPHPDVLHGARQMKSDPQAVKGIALVLEDLNIPLSESFKTIDHVYTITSQAGFEALMRGIKVTTVGCPFYSGWGLTDDRQHNPRRKRKLSVEEVFAAAYLLYPIYFDPIHNKKIEASEAIEMLLKLKEINKNTTLEQIETDEALEDKSLQYQNVYEEYFYLKKRIGQIEKTFNEHGEG